MYGTAIINIKGNGNLNCSGERKSSDSNKGLRVDMKFVLVWSVLFPLEACSASL